MFQGTVLLERNGINGTDRILTGNGTDWNGTNGMNTMNGTHWNGTDWDVFVIRKHVRELRKLIEIMGSGGSLIGIRKDISIVLIRIWRLILIIPIEIKNKLTLVILIRACTLLLGILLGI